MLPGENLFWGVALPFLAISIAAFLVRRAASPARDAPHSISVELAVFALAIALACFAQTSWSFVPEESVHWMPWIVAALAMLAAFEAARFGENRWWRIARLAILSFGIVQLLGKRFATIHPGREGELGLAAIALLTFVAAELAGGVARELESPIAEATWALTFSAQALLVVAARYVMLALDSAAFSAAFGALTLVGFARRAEPRVRAALGRFAGAAAVLVAVESHQLARPDYSVWIWSLVALGVVAPLAIQLGPTKRWRFVSRFVAAALCALVPLAIAVAIVLRQSGGLMDG